MHVRKDMKKGPITRPLFQSATVSDLGHTALHQTTRQFGVGFAPPDHQQALQVRQQRPPHISGLTHINPYHTLQGENHLPFIALHHEVLFEKT
jgi:hypothetical protein